MQLNLFLMPVVVAIAGSVVIGVWRVARRRGGGGSPRMDGLLRNRDATDPPAPSARVMGFARRDGLIAGIREYRRETGVGLAVAKRVIEAALR